MSASESVLAALHLPRRFAQASWPRRIAAAAIFAAAAAIVWWAMRLPAAMPVEDAQGWQAMSGDEIRLVAPQGASLLDFQGPVGKGVTVSVDSAQLAPASAAGLAELGVHAPQGQAPIDWGLDDGGQGRAALRLSLAPMGPHPALVARMNAGDGVTGLTFAAEDARLAVSVSGALADAKPPLAHVRIGDQAFDVEAGAFPLAAEAPPGAVVSLSYAQADPDRGVFRWGVRGGGGQHFSDLALAAVQLRRAGEPDRADACGAAPGTLVAFSSMDVAKLSCAPTLRLRGLDLSRSGGAVQVTGLGFVAEHGKAHVFSWKAFTENPLIDGLAGAAFTGLVGWTIHTVLGRPKRTSTAPAPPKPRRRLAKPA